MAQEGNLESYARLYEQTKKERDGLAKEVAYLRMLVYKMSLGDLVKQHSKYLPSLRAAPHVQEMPR